MNKYGGMDKRELLKEFTDAGELGASDREILTLVNGLIAAIDEDKEEDTLSIAEKLAAKDIALGCAIAGEINFRRKNFKAAEDFFRRGAALGSTRSMLFLAELYNYNLIPGCKDPRKEYFLLMKKAAHLKDFQAVYQYACCFRDGIGTAPNQKVYFELLQQAVHGGCPDAKVEMAQLYITGLKGLVKKDIKKARAILKDLVDQNNGDAIFALGCSYIDSDDKKATDLFHQAAKLGVPEARAVLQMIGY